MLFVNEIAAIVHKVVAEYQGAANKNIGDAFLLVWKLKTKGSKHDKSE
jgi:class 3 adenylate cyclase